MKFRAKMSVLAFLLFTITSNAAESPRAAASEADGWLLIFAWITGACLILSLVVPSVCAWIEEIRKRPKV